MATFSEIVSDVAGRVNETTPAALTRIGLRVNSRYKRVTSSLGLLVFRRTSIQQAVVTGTRLQTITGIERVISVFDLTTSGAPRPIHQLSYDEMLETVPQTGAPNYFAVKSMGASSVTLMFDTTFDAALTLTIEGEINASTLSGAQIPAFSESFHDILVFGALADELRKKEKIQLARDAEAEYERMLSEMRLKVAVGGYLDLVQGKKHQGHCGDEMSTSGGGGGGGSTSTCDCPLLYFNVQDPLYGAVGNGVHDDTVAVQAAFTAAGLVGGTVVFPAGTYLCTADINVPVGINNQVGVLGTSWSVGGLKFSGAAVTRGLNFYEAAAPGTYSYCGKVEDLNISCVAGATRGLTFYNVNHPRAVRVYVHGAAGAGIKFNYTLMGRMEHCLLTGCGSATEGSVEVDNSTTWTWDQSRISGGDTTIGGLLVDRTGQVGIYGGAIESCGIPIKLCAKAEATTAVDGVIIDGIDLENPVVNFLDMGYGWSGTAFNGVKNVSVRSVIGSISGATDVRYGVKLKNTIDVHFENTTLPTVGASQTATYWLEGFTNLNTRIGSNRRQWALAIPYVKENGSLVGPATPQVDWTPTSPESVNNTAAVTGATPSILMDATQGGYRRSLTLTQAGATNLTRFVFSGTGTGMQLFVRCADANTTFIEATGATSGMLKLVGGADKLGIDGRVYHFFNDGTFWREVGSLDLQPVMPIGSTTLLGTDADLLEKTLVTLTIPANTFSTNARSGMELVADLAVINAGGTILVKVDGTTVGTVLPADITADGRVNVRMWLIRDAGTNLSGNIQCVFQGSAAASGSVAAMLGVTRAVTFTSTIAITITGQNDAVAAANRIQHVRSWVAFNGCPAGAYQ